MALWLDEVTPSFVRGGLISFGAGTSGRLSVLDASEIPPTFCCEPERIQGLIAGGEVHYEKLRGWEDDPQGFVPALESLDLGPNDIILGIAAGGTTPIVRGALEWAATRSHGPHTALLSCAPTFRRMRMSPCCVIPARKF